MKKILYTLLAVSIIFAACKKEDDDVVTPVAPSIVGVWSATNVIIDSTITVTVGGVLDPTQSGSGSETLTAEDAESPTSVEFLSNGTVYALHSYDPAEDDTSTYSISGSTLTITSTDEDPMDFEYTVDKTTLTLVMSIDTSVSMPPVEISASFSQTMNFNRE